MSSGLGDRFQTLHEIVRAARRELAPGPWDSLRRPRGGPYRRVAFRGGVLRVLLRAVALPRRAVQPEDAFYVSYGPVRVKCATLAWHTLKAALEGVEKTISTEE